MIKNIQNGFKTTGSVLALGLIGAIASSGAYAASCTSSGIVGTGTKTVTATLDGTISSSVGSTAGDGCTAMATGNLAHPGPITVFDETWVLIVSDVEADTSTGALTIIDSSGDTGDSLTGSWGINTLLTGSYDTFVVGLKPDGGYVYYNVGTTTSGTYGIPSSLGTDDKDLSHGLSHANLYGRVSNVPIPAAAWLFGSALIGLAGVARKKSA